LTPFILLISFTICLLIALLVRHRTPGNMWRRRILRGVAVALSIIPLAGLMFAPAQATTITEYAVPGNPGLWDLKVDGANSIVWFTESGANNVGYLNYADSTVRQIPVPTLNSQPWGITIPSNWAGTAAIFTESYGNRIGVVSSASNTSRQVAEYQIPTSGSGPRKIIFDSGRNCTWFTEYAAGQIGMFNMSAPPAWTGRIVEYKLPGGLSIPIQSNPIGLALDSIGPGPSTNRRYIWIADFGRKSIIRFLPETGEISEYSVYPFSPWDVAVDADGVVWFTAQRVGTDENIIGRLDPTRQEKESAFQSRWAFSIFRVPTPNSEVHELEIDSRGNVWFTEFSDQASKIGKYVPLHNIFSEYLVLMPISKPQGLALYESGGVVNVWFAEYGGRRIGRLRQPEGPTVSTTVWSISSAVSTSSTVLTVSTSPTTAAVTNLPYVTFSTPVIAPTTASTASSTLVDTVSVIKTSPTYGIYTYTYTTSTSYTTTTSTYQLTYVTVLTTSTTTSVTATSVSTTWEGLTVLSTATVQSISYITQTTSTTLTVTQVSTIFSPTVTVPTTVKTGANTTVYSPTVTMTSTTSMGATTTTTSTFLTSTTVYSPTVTMTTTTTSVTTALPLGISLRPCIIASAAYGSELAEPVQALRQFRDYDVRSTFAGSEFMKTFNSFYYSFSPAVASVVASSQAVAAPVRVLLYPLIGALQYASMVSRLFKFAPEMGVIMAGLFSSAVIGLVYVTPLLVVLRFLKKRK